MGERALIEDLRGNAAHWADLVLGRIADQLPGMVAGDESLALAVASTRALVLELAEALDTGATVHHAPPAALGFARHLARRGVRLADVLRSYRLGHELLYERCSALLAATGQRGDLIGPLMLRFADDVSREVADAFDAEREAVLRGSIVRRERLVASLLAGARVRVAEVEQVLGRRMAGAHLAMVGWHAEGDAEPDTVARAMRPLTDALGHDAPLVMLGASGDVHVWVTPAGMALDRIPAEAVAALQREGVRVAVGTPGSGLAGFVASRRQADAARTVAVLSPRAVVTAYADVALLALLLRDHAAAQTFAAEELAGLAADSRPASVLRDTVRAYLACHLDSTVTARRLRVHRNTVARRLRRAEELLGHPLDHRTSEVSAALAIVEVRGQGVSAFRT